MNANEIHSGKDYIVKVGHNQVKVKVISGSGRGGYCFKNCQLSDVGKGNHRRDGRFRHLEKSSRKDPMEFVSSGDFSGRKKGKPAFPENRQRAVRPCRTGR